MAGLRPADSIKTKAWSHFRYETKDTFAFNLFPEGFANLAKTARSALVLFDPFAGKGENRAGLPVLDQADGKAVTAMAAGVDLELVGNQQVPGVGTGGF